MATASDATEPTVRRNTSRGGAGRRSMTGVTEPTVRRSTAGRESRKSGWRGVGQDTAVVTGPGCLCEGGRMKDQT